MFRRSETIFCFRRDEHPVTFCNVLIRSFICKFILNQSASFGPPFSSKISAENFVSNQDMRAGTVFKQKHSLAIQIGNAASVVGTVLDEDQLMEAHDETLNHEIKG